MLAPELPPVLRTTVWIWNPCAFVQSVIPSHVFRGRDKVREGLMSHSVLPSFCPAEGRKERKTVVLLPRGTTDFSPEEDGYARESSGSGEEGIRADSVSSAYVEASTEEIIARRSILKNAQMVVDGGRGCVCERCGQKKESKNLCSTHTFALTRKKK